MEMIVSVMNRDENLEFLTEYRELRRVVICPICLSNFDDPVTLPCAHTFCQTCINNALNLRQCCPICSTAVTNRKNIVHDVFSSRILNKISALVASLEPKNYNHRTVNIHKYMPRSPVMSSRNTDGITVSSTTESNCPRNPVVTTSSVASIAPIAAVTTTPEVILDTPDRSWMKPGILVNVLPRTWSGINKLGGIGWILAIHDLDEPVDLDLGKWPTCDVKYVLDSTVDFHIPLTFVEQHKELDRTSRRSRHAEAKSSPSPAQTNSGGSGSKRKGSGPVDKKEENSSYALGSGNSDKAQSKRRKGVSAADVNSVGNSIGAQQRPMVVLTTAVEPIVAAKLASLAANHPGRLTVVTRFSSAVTHLVVAVDRQGVLKRRTMKYMQALMAGLWILTSAWVTDSASRNELLPEASYEVSKNAKATADHAPRRAREHAALINMEAVSVASNGSSSSMSSSSTLMRRLFDGVSVLLYGQYPTPGPPRSDLEELLGQGGARVFVDATEFLTHAETHFWSNDEADNEAAVVTSKRLAKQAHMVVVCTNLDFRDEFVAHLPDTASFQINSAKRTHGGSRNIVHVVSPLWALDSITNYELLPPAEYEV